MTDGRKRGGGGGEGGAVVRAKLAVLTADYLATPEQLATRPHRRPCDCGACRRWALELVIFGGGGDAVGGAR